MKHVEIDRTTDAPKLEPAKQLLWDAAAYMEKHGKAPANCDGKGPNGEVCALFALSHSVENAPHSDFNRAREILICHIGRWDIARWSDASDQATVVAAMRAAALS